jgi:hypothetical protein
MSTKNQSLQSSRRKFLSKDFPAGALLCLGCHSMLGATMALAGQQASLQKPKYTDNSGMTTEEVFRFAYGYCVPLFQNLRKKLGSKKLLELLKKASADNMAEAVSTMAKSYPTRDPKALGDLIQSYCSTRPYDKALTYEVVEKSDRAYEAKYTECLIAKLYREMNAADIGYAIECAPSDAIAKAFNPKIKATNPKNLMKGDNVCIERFELKS